MFSFGPFSVPFLMLSNSTQFEMDVCRAVKLVVVTFVRMQDGRLCLGNALQG